MDIKIHGNFPRKSPETAMAIAIRRYCSTELSELDRAAAIDDLKAQGEASKGRLLVGIMIIRENRINNG